MKGKKGDGYAMATLVLFTVIVLVVSWYSLSHKIEFKNPIGSIQYKLLNTYDNAENTLFYIDEAARYSAYEAINRLSEKGGLLTEDCGKYFGAPLLINDEKNCIPESKDMSSNFKATFSMNFDRYLYNNPLLNIQMYDYDLNLIDSKELKLIGKANQSLRIPIQEQKLAEIEDLTIIKEPYIIQVNDKEMVAKINDEYGGRIRDEIRIRGYQLDDKLVMAIIAQESKGNPLAVSPTGCAGLMQFCYKTAKDERFYSFFQAVSECKCSCSFKCNEIEVFQTCSCDQNDGRFDEDKSIQAGIKYIWILKNMFGKYLNGPSFAIASYNGGEGTILKAISKTKKSNPSWQEVSMQINPDLIEEVYCKDGCSNYWKVYENRKLKAEEIKGYVRRVSAYYEELIRINLEKSNQQNQVKESTGEKTHECCFCKPDCGAVCSIENIPIGQSCGSWGNGGSGKSCYMTYCKPEDKNNFNNDTIGQYSVNPSFKTTVDYDLSVYEKIYSALEYFYDPNTDISKQIEIAIDNPEKLGSYPMWNKQYVWDSGVDCDKEEERAFYTFSEDYYLCANSTDDGCYCEIKLKNNIAQNSRFVVSIQNQDTLITSGDKREVIKDFKSGYQSDNGGFSSIQIIPVAIKKNNDKYSVTINPLNSLQYTSYGENSFDASFYLYKKNNIISFIRPENYKVIEYENKICKIHRDKLKLCVDTGKKIPFIEDNKVVDNQDNIIKFGYQFRDTQAPSFVDNMILFYDVYFLKNEVILQWDHKDSQDDISKFNIYYTQKDISNTYLSNLEYYVGEGDVFKLEFPIKSINTLEKVDISSPKLEIIQTPDGKFLSSYYETPNFDEDLTPQGIKLFLENNKLYKFINPDEASHDYTYFAKITFESMNKYNVLITSLDYYNNEKIEIAGGRANLADLTPQDNLAPATWPLEGFNFNVPVKMTGDTFSVWWPHMPKYNVDGSIFNINDLGGYRVYYTEGDMNPNNYFTAQYVDVGPDEFSVDDHKIADFEITKKYCFYVVPYDKNNNMQFNEETRFLMSDLGFFDPLCSEAKQP